MDLKVACLLAKGRWIMGFVCFLITYICCIYSGAIKRVLGYDQETLTTLEFFKGLGGNIGILSGLANEIPPPWVVLGIEAIIICITGHLMIWLSVTQRIARPKTWQMYLCIFLRANSQTFANTGALVTCVKNFPQRSRSVLGILKEFVGLSGAIFTQIYHAIYGQANRGIILLLGILPAALSLAIMSIVRPTKLVADRKELKRFYNFLYIALALQGFLMIIIVAENRMKDFPQSVYQIIAALVILFLMFNIVVIVNAEMDNMRLQRMTSLARNESLKPVQIDAKIKDEEKPKTEICFGNFSSEDPVNQKEGKNNEQPISLRSLVINMFKSPTRGEDYSSPQALVRVDFCQIGKALGYIPISINPSVSLMTIWNFPGPLLAGFLSGILLTRKRREGERKVLKHLPCCDYTDLKKASLLARNAANGRWSVVFLCVLLMSTAEGASMRGIYSQTQSVQTVGDTDINRYVPVNHSGHDASETVVHTPGGTFNLEKCKAGGDANHSIQVVVGKTERVLMGRRLLGGGKSKPPTPSINKGPPGQHDEYKRNSPGV